jgi:MFS family permease
MNQVFRGRARSSSGPSSPLIVPLTLIGKHRSAASEATAPGIPDSAKHRGYILTAGVLVAIMMGGTLPIPLYVLYENQMGFGPLGVTVVFASYVIGTLFALVTLGDLSDHFGRRKVMTIAVVCAAVSSGLFLGASNIGMLIAARIVSGLAAGFITGTAAAALTELQPRGDRRGAAIVASGGNLAGLGLGPLVAGIFAEYVAVPTHSVFWLYLGVCASALAALVFIPEPVRNPDRAFNLRPHLGIPTSMRAVMIGACLGVFAAFSVLGSFSSLVPTFMHGILGVHNLALVGGASFLAFMVAAISQAVSARLPARRSLELGLPLLLVCLAALESALFAKALWLFLVGTVVGGIAVGLIFRGGLSEINRLAEPRNRAATVSTFFVAAYVGLGLPAVLTGIISQLTGTVDASVYTAALSAAFVIAAVVVVFRSFGTAAAPETSGTLSDSWCVPEEPVGLRAVDGTGGEHGVTGGSGSPSRPTGAPLRAV